mmetsp:Transcript_17957/g.42331  ORF Transcript_17957/g.42331 Transcript_17957/m.42331 type:complete len:264 (+) Transcript_17957:196-987(+)
MRCLRTRSMVSLSVDSGVTETSGGCVPPFTASRNSVQLLWRSSIFDTSTPRRSEALRLATSLPSSSMSGTALNSYFTRVLNASITVVLECMCVRVLIGCLAKPFLLRVDESSSGLSFSSVPSSTRKCKTSTCDNIENLPSSPETSNRWTPLLKISRRSSRVSLDSRVHRRALSFESPIITSTGFKRRDFWALTISSAAPTSNPIIFASIDHISGDICKPGVTLGSVPGDSGCTSAASSASCFATRSSSSLRLSITSCATKSVK